MYIEINALHFPYDELRPLVCQDSPREQLQQKLNLKYFLFTMEDTSPHSCNKLTEEQIEQLIKRLRGVEHIEPIEDSNVNNEKMATFAEVVNNQSSNKNNTDESDSKHGEQNKDYASGDSVKPLFLVDQDVFGSIKPDRTHWLTNVEIYKAVGSKVPTECIKGIQRIRYMWRIYMDNTEDRITLIVEGLNLRGRRVPLHTQNPRNPQRFRPLKLKISLFPLMAAKYTVL